MRIQYYLKCSSEELEKRWAEFVESGEKGIDASELRARALTRHHEIILKERELRIAAGTATFQDWKRAKAEIRGKTPR